MPVQLSSPDWMLPLILSVQIYWRSWDKELLPNLNTTEATLWMRHRPALSDSLPVIGPLPGHPNVLAAFGHGHTGLTGAPMTGRIIASLVFGVPLNVDITPYQPERFSLSIGSSLN